MIRQYVKQYEKTGTMVLVRPAVFKTVRLACKARRRFDSPCPFHTSDIALMKQHFTIGVAGHVDHGKTSFVKNITGIDTDRHPEEKQRGLSLEAGIACWPRPDGTTASFVDVPGHSNFLKNTVRGLQGVDLTVLVVAADDGVMPQTREHLDILSFFQVEDGIVVISKADCVDSETLELAEMEVMELTEGTFLETKPIVPFSAISGSGRAEVIAALDMAMARSVRKTRNKPFRLWIDQIRSFTGIGMVASGTILSGKVSVNDELMLLPDKAESRVRSLENHGQKVNEAVAGQRIGLSLNGIQAGQLKRGMCLVHPGEYTMVHRFNAVMQSARHTEETVKNRQKVKLYLGTAVLNGVVKYIEPLPHETVGYHLIQIQLPKSAPIAAGDNFAISPMNKNSIIAGGRVLELSEEKIRQANKKHLSSRLTALLTYNPQAYIEHLCQLHPGIPFEPELLITRTAWPQDAIQSYIASGIDRGKLILMDDGRIALTSELGRFMKIFSEIITCSFQKQPDRGPIQCNEILHQCNPPCDMEFAHLVLENLCKNGEWLKENGGIRPVALKRKLPHELSMVASALRRYADEQGIRPFSAEYFIKTSPEKFTLSQVRKSLDFFCKTDELIRLKNDRYLTSSALNEIKKRVAMWEKKYGEISLRDCKKVFDFNRGIGLHVLEYLDQIGFTLRRGEGRKVVGK